MNLSKCVDNILPALPPAKIKKKKKEKEKRREKEKKEKEKNPLFSVVQDVGLGQRNEKTYRLRRKEEEATNRN